MTRAVLIATVVLLAAACNRDRPAVDATATDSASHTAQHVDSVVPREVAIERFREGTQQVTSFTGGAKSRDALVKAWVKAIESRRHGGAQEDAHQPR